MYLFYKGDFEKVIQKTNRREKSRQDTAMQTHPAEPRQSNREQGQGRAGKRFLQSMEPKSALSID